MCSRRRRTKGLLVSLKGARERLRDREIERERVKKKHRLVRLYACNTCVRSEKNDDGETILYNVYVIHGKKKKLHCSRGKKYNGGKSITFFFSPYSK